MNRKNTFKIVGFLIVDVIQMIVVIFAKSVNYVIVGNKASKKYRSRCTYWSFNKDNRFSFSIRVLMPIVRFRTFLNPGVTPL